jgi:sugar/nucleoside kinase (ribokinase family)
MIYDLALLGNFTKDTIISASGTRVVDGGAFNYGAQMAARMGLRVTAITRLASQDFRVVEELERLGVDVFARATPHSTCLRLEYPSSNVDERVIHVASTAGAFTPAEVEGVEARAFVIAASLRGEVGLDVIKALSGKVTTLAADVQGFVRVLRDGMLVYESWPQEGLVLSQIDVLKTDAVEAEMLTGEADIRIAARMLADMGPQEIVLTHRDGLLVYASGQHYKARWFPKKLLGRSGRGDTCLAAYVGRRLSTPPADATAWAAAATSLKMEAEGPFRRDAYEVEDLVRRRYA